jgi:hypothetical protein
MSIRKRKKSPWWALPTLRWKFSRQGGGWRLPPPQGFHEEHLDVAQVALEEAALAVAEIIPPHADETLRVAESAHPVDVGEGPFTPGAEGPGVVAGDVLQVQEPEIGGAGAGYFS